MYTEKNSFSRISAWTTFLATDWTINWDSIETIDWDNEEIDNLSPNIQKLMNEYAGIFAPFELAISQRINDDGINDIKNNIKEESIKLAKKANALKIKEESKELVEKADNLNIIDIYKEAEKDFRIVANYSFSNTPLQPLKLFQNAISVFTGLNVGGIEKLDQTAVEEKPIKGNKQLFFKTVTDTEKSGAELKKTAEGKIKTIQDIDDTPPNINNN